MSGSRLLYLGLVPCLAYLLFSLRHQDLRGVVWTWISPPNTLRQVLLDPSTQWSNGTKIRLQGEGGFSEVTGRWNTFDAPTYSAAISPASEDDVVKAVSLATKNRIPFLATGGRHGYSTSLGRLRNGLAIDMGSLDTVKVNKAAGTLTIGGGVRWSQVLDHVFDAGFEMQTGVCSCPGVVGVTLGGGIGRHSGRFGLVLDALLSVRIVTADGRLLTVSETSNPDLFWGLRGAGGNFGVVTSATYRLQPLGGGKGDDNKSGGRGHVLMADMVIPAVKSADYFKILESFNGSMPAKLAIHSVISYSEPHQDAAIIANWVYMGPEDDGRAAFKQLLALDEPITAVRTVPWPKIIASHGFGTLDAALCQTAGDRSIYGVNVRHLDAATYQSVFEKISAFYQANPEARGTAVALEMWPNQAMMAVPDDATAYPWRDARANILIGFSWASPESSRKVALASASDSLGRELRDDFVRTSGYPDLSVYVGYAHSDETLEQIYGREKLPRLAALKKEWDPLNVFAYNNPLPTEYPAN